MEQHNSDPTPEDPWTEASARWSSIGEGLRRRYRDLVGDEGPDEEAVREAFRTLGDAAQSVVTSIGTAMKDPDVRAQVREAATSLVSALGTTFDELGDELRRTFAEDEAAEAHGIDTDMPSTNQNEVEGESSSVS